MKSLSKEEIIDLLMKAEDGALACTDGKYPYCIPFGFVYVGDKIFFTFFPTGRKWDYIQKNPNVCFNVYKWNDEGKECDSVVVDGVLEETKDLAEIESMVKANIVKMGLDEESYLKKRMEYYEKAITNPKALKIFKFTIREMQGIKIIKQT